MNEKIRDMIDAIGLDKPVEAEEFFKQAIADKVYNSIQVKKQEIAQSLYKEPTEG
jgi:hypothetical protein